MNEVQPLNLSARATVKALLERFSLRADKAFGQNFLVDDAILTKIVAAAGLSSADSVLEIGPGLGVLTGALAQTGARVTTVELDDRLLPLLSETVEVFTNVELIHADGLSFDFSKVPKGSLLVANLPYNVATPILMRALESGQFKRLVFLVQKEVAERFTASPGVKAYGALSVVMQYYARPKKLFEVKPGSFMPPPEVTSAVVRLDVNTDVTSDKVFVDFVHNCFRYRRKTLRKNLQMMGFELDTVVGVLEKLGLSATLRAEALELDMFKRLYLLLY